MGFPDFYDREARATDARQRQSYVAETNQQFVGFIVKLP
jgi:hypothetical protein